jgi:hypothetical protein
MASGSEGDRTAGRSHLAQAGAIADRIGEDRDDYNTEFGPTNIRLSAMNAGFGLGAGPSRHAMRA